MRLPVTPSENDQLLFSSFFNVVAGFFVVISPQLGSIPLGFLALFLAFAALVAKGWICGT